MPNYPTFTTLQHGLVLEHETIKRYNGLATLEAISCFFPNKPSNVFLMGNSNRYKNARCVLVSHKEYTERPGLLGTKTAKASNVARPLVLEHETIKRRERWSDAMQLMLQLNSRSEWMVTRNCFPFLSENYVIQ